MNAAAALAGCRMGLRRTGHPAALAAGAALIVVDVALAWSERRSSFHGAASQVLEGTVFAWMVPLTALFGSIRTLAGARLDDATVGLARFGCSRRFVALGLVAANMIVAGSLSGMVAFVAAAVAHDPTAMPVVRDAFTSAWIGVLASVAYCGWFALGSTFGRRGGGRLGALAIDLVFAGSGGLWAVFLPHGHAINLLGGEAPLALGQPVSALALVALAVACTGVAVARCDP